MLAMQSCSRYILSFAAAAIVFTSGTEAAVIARRADNGGGGGNSLAIWIPVVVVGVVILLACIIKLRRRARLAQPGAIVTTPQIREVTAAQLTGQVSSTTTGNGSNSGRATPGDGNDTTTPTPARRPRRNRRTPSQISTKSLPAYNAEPGDEEVVIYRGPEEEEQHPSAGGRMTTVQEAESPRGSLDTSAHRVYVPEPQDTIDTPLLMDNPDFPDPDTSLPSVNPPRSAGHASHASMDTLAPTEESSTSLLGGHRRDSSGDQRGPAPGYYEVVLNDPPAPPVRTPSSARSPPTTSSPPPPEQDVTFPTAATTASRRTSVIRGFFSQFSGHSRQPTATSPPIPPTPAEPAMSRTHTRPSSALSRTHTRSGSAVSGTSSRPGHRPSHSGSSRHLNFLHRANGSTQHLSSPSLISLHSISSPLSHTLTRTEIVYPKSGPTPEQIKLISSRESLGRFGVPYGADAVAFAHSSRQDLGAPPEFESLPDVVAARRSTSDDAPGPSASADTLEVAGEASEQPAQLPTLATMLLRAPGGRPLSMIPASPADDAPTASAASGGPETATTASPPNSAPPTSFRGLRRQSSSDTGMSVTTTHTFATAPDTLNDGASIADTERASIADTDRADSPGFLVPPFAYAIEPPTPLASHPSTPHIDTARDRDSREGSVGSGESEESESPQTPIGQHPKEKTDETIRHAKEDTDATVRESAPAPVVVPAVAASA